MRLAATARREHNRSGAVLQSRARSCRVRQQRAIRQNTPAAHVARHRQAHPTALARGLPDGRAARADGARRQGERRGLLRDVGRSVRETLLLGPRGAARARRTARLAARRVHRRGALHASLRALLPARVQPRGRGARGAPDRALPARGNLRLCRAAAARAPEPRPRSAWVRAAAERDRRPGGDPRGRLLAGDAWTAREARERDLQAAHAEVQLPGDLARRGARADDRPVCAAPRRRTLVRDRP